MRAIQRMNQFSLPSRKIPRCDERAGQSAGEEDGSEERGIELERFAACDDALGLNERGYIVDNAVSQRHPIRPQAKESRSD